MNVHQYAHKANPDTWRDHTHEQLVRQLIGEVVAADAREQHARQLSEFERDDRRRWAARVWADNQRGARVIATLEAARKKGRKTVKINEILEAARLAQ